MKFLKALALILAMLICLSAFAACEKDGDEGESNSESSTPGAGGTEEIERFDYFGADMTKYIDLSATQYKGLTITLDADYNVTDEKVEEQIAKNIFKYRTKKNSDNQVTDQPINIGDSAFIYYKGYLNGEAFDGGSNWDDEKPYELGIGSGSFIPGFEEGLVGLIPESTSKDQPFDLNVTFPENYNSADLAGKSVVFKVCVVYTVQYELATLTADIVTEKLKFTTEESDVVAAYRSAIRKELEETGNIEARNVIWEMLLDSANVLQYPGKEVDYYYNSYIDQYEYNKEYYKYYGYNFATLDEFVIAYLGLEKGADWKAVTTENSKIDVAQNLLFHAIAQAENIIVTSADYQDSINYYVDYYKYYGQTYTQQEIEKQVGTRMLKENALFQNVNEFLLENITITYKAD